MVSRYGSGEGSRLEEPSLGMEMGTTLGEEVISRSYGAGKYE